MERRIYRFFLVSFLLVVSLSLVRCSDDDDADLGGPSLTDDAVTVEPVTGVTEPTQEGVREVGQAQHQPLEQLYNILSLAVDKMPGAGVATLLEELRGRLAEVQGADEALALRSVRLDYRSIDHLGRSVWLSERVVAPERGGELESGLCRVVVGCHATLTDDAGRPSALGLVSDAGLMSLLAAPVGQCDGSLVVVPDCQGFGAAADLPQAYLCEQLTARQTLDGVLAARLWYEGQAALADDCHSVAVGYSQGGSSALAVHRYVEENGLTARLRFLGSVCGAGPYSPWATAREYAKVGRAELPVALVMMVQAQVECGARLRGRFTLDDYLQPLLLTAGVADLINGGELTTDEVDARLGFSGGADLGALFLPEVLALMRGDVAGLAEADVPKLAALRQALLDNDLLEGWLPERPALLFHGVSDEVVPFVNYTAALAAFDNGQVRGLRYKGDAVTGHAAMAAVFLAQVPGLLDALADGSWKELPADCALE